METPRGRKYRGYEGAKGTQDSGLRGHQLLVGTCGWRLREKWRETAGGTIAGMLAEQLRR
jgi:hypothetical protein